MNTYRSHTKQVYTEGGKFRLRPKLKDVTTEKLPHPRAKCVAFNSLAHVCLVPFEAHGNITDHIFSKRPQMRVHIPKDGRAKNVHTIAKCGRANWNEITSDTAEDTIQEAARVGVLCVSCLKQHIYDINLTGLLGL